MSMSETRTDKEAIVLRLLAEGDTMLCLDARRKGVRAPAAHLTNPNLRLILNLNFPHPIEVTAQGISAKLSFGGRRSACYIPMDALWAAFNPQTMQGMLWPESMPAEIQAEIEAQPQPQPPATPAKQRGPLRSVRSPKKARAAATPEPKTPPSTTPSAGTTRQRGHLRLVK